MLVSDFLHAKSTHEFLVSLFASEIGLLSVCSPGSQYMAYEQLFVPLKTNLLQALNAKKETISITGLKDEFETPIRAEAELFTRVYSKNELCLDDDTVMRLKVYPQIGFMLKSHSQLRDFLSNLLKAHIDAYNTAVGKRIRDNLPRFGLTAKDMGL